jgi:hypothetical protein
LVDNMKILTNVKILTNMTKLSTTKNVTYNWVDFPPRLSKVWARLGPIAGRETRNETN